MSLRDHHIQQTYHGRTKVPIPTSNGEEFEQDLPEFESFGVAEPRPRGPAPPGVYDDGSLTVVSVDMFLRDNKNAHNTTPYQNDNLIIRRGTEFLMGVTCSQSMDPSIHELQIELLIGANPSATKGSFIILHFSGQSSSVGWECRVVETRGEMTVVGITSPSDTIIGKFRTYVAIITPLGIKRTKRNPETDLYMLFNAWSPADTVHVPSEAERREYVMSDYGTMYLGDENNVSWRPWAFGQFEGGVLDACIYILDRCHMPIYNRGDAVKVARKGSAMINCQDDDGVLVGNWSEDYSLGTPPTSWTGSVHILLEYAAKGLPMKFAQCWVFAGVFNTFLRCLGMPSRAITNFCSAHDNTGNLKTDLIFTPDGRPDDNNTRDSIWNYHCWNEVYMARPDLPEGLGGWQVMDATPQETSDGQFRCGPTSVKCIKEGTLCYPYDAPFVFAEVNSDVIFHKRTKYGTMEAYRVDTTHVGKLILTKAVGRDQPEDITHTYKYPEGSSQDQATMDNAEEYGCMRDHSSLPEFDVVIEILAVQVKMGDNFHLQVEFKNLGESPRTIRTNLNCSVIYYTGVTVTAFKEEIRSVTLEAGKTERVSVEILAEEYMPLLKSQNSLQFTVTGQVLENGQSVTALRVVRLLCPPLNVTVGGIAEVNQSMFVTVEFINPFAFTLENVVMTLEGLQILPYRTRSYREIGPNASASWTESFVPQTPGQKKLLSSLDCPALREVFGGIEFSVM